MIALIVSRPLLSVAAFLLSIAEMVVTSTTAALANCACVRSASARAAFNWFPVKSMSAFPPQSNVVVQCGYHENHGPRQDKTGFGHDKTAHNHENMGFVSSAPALRVKLLLLQLFEVTFPRQ